MLQCFFKYLKEVLNILPVNGSQSTKSECICGGNFSGINGKSPLIAVIMHLHKIPVGIVGINDGNHKPCLPFSFNNVLKAQFFNSFMDSLKHAGMPCPLIFLTLCPILLQSLYCGVNGLHGRSEVHFPCLFKKVIL